MISLADLLFLAGLAAIVGGAWQIGTGQGIVACGGTACLAAYVLRWHRLARRRRRG